ncbi:MAG TPA: cache domain-containing protein [Ornithinibacter sp.]|nr:cache domain-containing protein [Ornithinibacter sp.]
MNSPTEVEAEARALVARVDELGTWVGETVAGLASLAARQLRGPLRRRADLDLEGRCRALLEQREIPLAGAGFVAETEVLHDAPYWLEWWTADPEVGASSCRRLAADTDPTSVGFRDYTELPWFVTPRETGRTHVTGPYVDYVCTDQHTLTVTRPVSVDGVFLGVAGVDVLAATVERLLGATLDTASGVLVVVNRVGRVVASSDPEHVVGDLVRGLPDDPWFTGRRDARNAEGEPWRFVACRSVPLGVLSRP